MKIIKPSVEFYGVVPTDYENALKFIEKAGRTCYKSEDKITDDSAEKFVKKLIKAGHLAMVEHSNFVVRMYRDSYYLPMFKYLNTYATSDIVYMGGNLTAWFQSAVELEHIAKPFYHQYGKLFDAENLDFIMEMIGDFPEWQICPHNEIPKELHRYSAKFICDRGCCYSADTDVLTSEGWVSWPEIKGSELFATLNRGTHEVEYQESSAIIREPYKGELYQLQTSLINLQVTPGHNMYIRKHDTQAAKRKEQPWELAKAESICGKRVSYKRDANPQRSGVEFIVIPDFETSQGNRYGGMSPHTRSGKTYRSKDFAKFLGYWISEGCIEHGSSYSVQLFQNEGPVLQEMLRVISAMGYEYNLTDNGSPKNKRIRFCDVALYHWLLPYSGVLNKRIPREIMETFGSDDLSTLLDAYIDGDGSVHKVSGHRQAYTVSKGLADDLQELALKIGISATVWIDDRVGQKSENFGAHGHVCYVISFVTEKNTPLVNHGAKKFKGVTHETTVPYDGTVYCATVPNHTLYVRRNGRPCWSGNSHELVRHRPCSFAQESTRYVNYCGKDMEFIEPAGFDEWTVPQQEMVFSACRQAEAHYSLMVEEGLKPQQARAVLPNALKTEIVVTADAAEWQHIKNLRTASGAHPDMQRVMNMLPWESFL